MLFSENQRSTRLLFGGADAVLIPLSFIAAYLIRAWLGFLPKEFELQPHAAALAVLVWLASWIGAGIVSDVYSRLPRSTAGRVVRDVTVQALYATSAMVITEFALHLDLSRLFLFLLTFFTWLSVLLLRLRARAFVKLFLKEYGEKRSVLIIGNAKQGAHVAQELEWTMPQDVHVCGFVPVRPEGEPTEWTGHATYAHTELSAILRSHIVDEVIFAVESQDLPFVAKLLQLCEEEGVRTHVILDFFPQIESQLRLDYFGSSPTLTFTVAPDDHLRLLLKRCVDITLSGLGLLLASPIMLLAAIAIKLSSPGPIIFRQDRCGLNGRQFVCYKFRSMVQGAEARQSEVAHLSRRTTAPKVPNDPRLTPVGGFLRQFSIDELPQLFNVLKGDMSIVGPRPAIPGEVDIYEQWQRRRLRMRPGLTCLWAINGRDEVDFETWMKMDLAYIERWSIGLDIEIILKTIPVVVFGKGAS